MAKKILSLCMCLVLVLAALPALAFTDAELAAAEKLVMEQVQELTDEAEDPYIKWMLSRTQIAGVTEGRTLTYTLAMPNPGSALTQKEMGKISGQELLKQVLAGYAAADEIEELLINLTLKEKDGVYTAEWSNNNSPRKVSSKVKGLASAARKTYQAKAIAAAVEDVLFPAPASLEKKRPAAFPAERSEAYQAFLPIAAEGLNASADSLLKTLAYYLCTFDMDEMDVSKGVEAVKVDFAAGDVNTMLANAKQGAYEELLSMTGVPAMTRDTLEAYLLKSLEQAALAQAYSKSKAEHTANVSLLALSTDGVASSEDMLQLYTAYLTAYDAALDSLCETAAGMAPYPKQDQPETSILSGSGNGTLVYLEASNHPVYVKFLDAADKAAVTAFVRAGETLEIQLPKGDYTLHYAKGTVWYGEENLFGEDGIYGEGLVPIEDQSFQHTIKLYTVTEGNLATYAVPSSNF